MDQMHWNHFLSTIVVAHTINGTFLKNCVKHGRTIQYIVYPQMREMFSPTPYFSNCFLSSHRVQLMNTIRLKPSIESKTVQKRSSLSTRFSNPRTVPHHSNALNLNFFLIGVLKMVTAVYLNSTRERSQRD